MKLIQISGSDFEITERIKAGAESQPAEGTVSRRTLLTDRRTIFDQTPSPFRVTYPVNGAELLSANPFFYEDDQRTFFIGPSEKTFEKELLQQLPPFSITEIVQVSVEEVVPKEDDLPSDLDGFVRDGDVFDIDGDSKEDRLLAGDS